MCPAGSLRKGTGAGQSKDTGAAGHLLLPAREKNREMRTARPEQRAAEMSGQYRKKLWVSSDNNQTPGGISEKPWLEEAQEGQRATQAPTTP